MKEVKNKWFTLVELIVVITILAILWTIAFISLQWYSKEARNSVRLTDLANINKALELTLMKVWKVPLPENNIPITLSWELIWNQWDIAEKTLNNIWIHGWWKDPLDELYYSYYINSTQNKYQILWFLEESDSLWLVISNEIFAVDNTKRVPIVEWDWLWIIIDINNQPIHRLQEVITATEFDTIWTEFASKDIRAMFSNDSKWYMISLQLWGQLQQIWKWSYEQPSKCPDNFIPVPWSIELWQPGFCVWKYEMSSIVVTDNLAATWQTLPWFSPTLQRNYLFKYCQNIWDWYNTMSVNQWLTIARNIELQSVNWSWWEVWSWYIYSWNNWSSITWFDLWTTFLNAWPSWITNQDKLRQLQLSNWEIIWDLIWNAWEYVRWLNINWQGDEFQEYQPILGNKEDNSNFFKINWITPSSTIYNKIEDISDSNFTANYLSKVNNKSSLWMWAVVYPNNWTKIYVWWDRNWWENQNWLYSMIVNYNSHAGSNIWTRCVYTK